MKNIFDKRIAAPLAVLVLASLAVTPVAGARGGGGAGASNRQVDNSRQDSRTNEVRGNSVNNVNASRNTNVNSNSNVNVNSNRNVNVNVDSNNGCCGNGWDNDHPVAAAAVVTAVVVGIGTRVAAPPPNCVPVNRGGIVYQQCGSTWYQPQGGQYVVVAPPP